MPEGGQASGRPGGRLWFVLALLWPLLPAMAAAQADTARADTTRIPGDTVDAYSLMVAGQEEAQTRVRKFPRTGQERLLPPLGRIVLPRDSIDFINAETLGDVLATIPGVYLWRGGWIGRPELPNYFGRGATSVEYLIDGVPFVPLGPDSLAIDPSLMPIGLIDRIELEPVPGLLRVHLMLRNHEVLAPRTRVVVARGNPDQARYEGLIEKRFRSGLGFALGVEFAVRDAAETAGALTNSSGWLQTDWVPTRGVGLQLRYLINAPERSATLHQETPDTLIRPVEGRRGDFTARVFLGGAAEERLGPRADLLFSNTTWSSDSLNQDRWQAGLLLSNRGRTHHLGASAFLGSRWTTLDTRVQAGWSPVELLSLAVEGAYQEYDNERDGRWILGRAGLSLPLGLTVSGAWRAGDAVQQPNVLSDRDQALSDGELTVSLEPARLFGARAGLTRLAAFRPTGMWPYAQVDSIAPSGATSWFTAGGRLTPRQWLTLSGWYNHALETLPEGTPPDHSLIELAIRSQFLRTFPSGILDLKLAATMESWGTGVLGRNPAGEPVTLKGATFFRALAQLRLAGFLIYFDRSNLLNTTLSYVPDLRIPANAYSFGIRWTFLN